MSDMFWGELSEAQKIDYIYKSLKRQERWSYFKNILKILILIGFIYIYFNVDMDKIISDISAKIAPQMSSFIEPISQDLINNMMNDMNKNMQIDPQMLNKLRDNFSN